MKVNWTLRSTLGCLEKQSRVFGGTLRRSKVDWISYYSDAEQLFWLQVKQAISFVPISPICVLFFVFSSQTSWHFQRSFLNAFVSILVWSTQKNVHAYWCKSQKYFPAQKSPKTSCWHNFFQRTKNNFQLTTPLRLLTLLSKYLNLLLQWMYFSY